MEKKSITIDHARRVLGKRGKVMTDKQVMNLLTMLRTICDKSIDVVIEKRPHVKT